MIGRYDMIIGDRRIDDRMLGSYEARKIEYIDQSDND